MGTTFDGVDEAVAINRVCSFEGLVNLCVVVTPACSSVNHNIVITTCSDEGQLQCVLTDAGTAQHDVVQVVVSLHGTVLKAHGVGSTRNFFVAVYLFFQLCISANLEYHIAEGTVGSFLEGQIVLVVSGKQGNTRVGEAHATVQLTTDRLIHR